MTAKFEIKKSKKGQFFFNLKAANGQVILTGEEYTTKASAMNGIKSVQTNSAVDARFERKVSGNSKPYFVLKAANGEPLGRSQMYSSASSMKKGMNSVKTNAAGAAVQDLTE